MEGTSLKPSVCDAQGNAMDMSGEMVTDAFGNAMQYVAYPGGPQVEDPEEPRVDDPKGSNLKDDPKPNLATAFDAEVWPKIDQDREATTSEIQKAVADAVPAQDDQHASDVDFGAE